MLTADPGHDECLAAGSGRGSGRWAISRGALAAAAAAAAACGNPEPPSIPAAVDGGERAVMYDRIQGVLEEPIGEGMHVRIPWFQVRPGRDGCLDNTEAAA